jgi:hypothetical protein
MTPGAIDPDEWRACIHSHEGVPRGSIFVAAPCPNCEYGKSGGLPCRTCEGTGIAAFRVDGLAL